VSAAVGAANSCVMEGSGLAQPPFGPDDWKFASARRPNTRPLLVDARDPDFPVARKIGAAIAAAMLLQPRST